MAERILMLGYAGMIAQERVMQWALESGHEILVLTPQIFPPKFIESERLTLITFPHAWLPTSVEGAAEQIMAPLAALIRDVYHLYRPTLAHLHGLNNGIISLVAAGIPISKIVSVWGGLNTILYAAQHYVSGNRAMDRCLECLSAMDAVIVESPLQVEVMRSRYPSVKEVAMIPMGVDTERFSRSPSVRRAAYVNRLRYGIAPDDFVFCSPRGFAPSYRPAEILRAFGEGDSYFAKRSWLLIVGLRRQGARDSLKQLWQQMVALSHALGVNERIVWIPELPYAEMPSLYGMSDVVINMPVADAFPSTILEAMACERLVISSDLPTYHTTPVYEHLWRVSPHDQSQLTERMVEATRLSPTDYSALGASARAAIIGKLDKQESVRQMQSLYCRLIAQGT
ncbi:MAG: glycosyltransferase family 4 protein [Ardenticatenales bacterium]|nr:glycosyltransferase family 4 protein [Ardenticatenales bacterium]